MEKVDADPGRENKIRIKAQEVADSVDRSRTKSRPKSKPWSGGTELNPATIAEGEENVRQLVAEHETLVAEIDEHNRRYHAEDAPTISDEAYEKLQGAKASYRR